MKIGYTNILYLKNGSNDLFHDFHDYSPILDKECCIPFYFRAKNFSSGNVFFWELIESERDRKSRSGWVLQVPFRSTQYSIY